MDLGQRFLACAVMVGTIGLLGCQTPDDRLAQQRTNNQWLQVNQAKSFQEEAGPEPDILPVTRFTAGRLFEQQKQTHRAILQYRKAVELNPQFTVAYNRLGICLDKIGQHADAERVFREAVRLAPELTYLRNNLAFNLMAQGRWQEAERELRTVLQLKPGYDRARVNLGIALSKQSLDDEAFEQFQMVLGEAVAHYNMGLMYKSEGKYAEATDSFRQAVAHEPKRIGAEDQLEQLRSLLSEAPQNMLDGPAVAASRRFGGGQMTGQQVVVDNPLPVYSVVQAELAKERVMGEKISESGWSDHNGTQEALPAQPQEAVPQNAPVATGQAVTAEEDLDCDEDDGEIPQEPAIEVRKGPITLQYDPCEVTAIEEAFARIRQEMQPCTDGEYVDQFVFGDGGYELDFSVLAAEDRPEVAGDDENRIETDLDLAIRRTLAAWRINPRWNGVGWGQPNINALLIQLQADLYRNWTMQRERLEPLPKLKQPRAPPEAGPMPPFGGARANRRIERSWDRFSTDN